MIRRDYLLRMIEQCIQALTRSLNLTKEGLFDQARQEVDKAIHGLTGLDESHILNLAESDLIAALLQGEPTQLLGQKCMLLVALLHQAGEVLAAQSKPSESRLCYLKALNLQLTILNQEGPLNYPEFVPKVEALLTRLDGEELPIQTIAALMQHYENVGDYGKAEDSLFRLIEGASRHREVIAFGIHFYERLLRKSDETLSLGNLPRSEVESGLADLRLRLGPSPRP